MKTLIEDERKRGDHHQSRKDTRGGLSLVIDTISTISLVPNCRLDPGGRFLKIHQKTLDERIQKKKTQAQNKKEVQRCFPLIGKRGDVRIRNFGYENLRRGLTQSLRRGRRRENLYFSEEENEISSNQWSS